MSLHRAAFAAPAKPAAARAALLERLRARLPDIQAGTARLDEQARFPTAEFEALIQAGLLPATLPVELGGLGFGTGEDGAKDLFRLLHLLGEASLPTARLYEAHVIALQLIQRYGTPSQMQRAAKHAHAGQLFALWVTDPPEGAAALGADGVLRGGKAFCSGAGVIRHAVITAETSAGAQMLILELEPDRPTQPSRIRLAGMRASVTGSVDLTDLEIPQDARHGKTGDYLREPVFSAGAWRGAAAALGGLKALIAVYREEIIRRGRSGDPHQRARFGKVATAHETARLWTEQAALRGCLEDDTADAIIAYINLARLAVEAACLDAMRDIQRSLGLSAFMAGQPAERLARDLATYLRQPAPDEVLDRAAEHYLANGLPGAT